MHLQRCRHHHYYHHFHRYHHYYHHRYHHYYHHHFHRYHHHYYHYYDRHNGRCHHHHYHLHLCHHYNIVNSLPTNSNNITDYSKTIYLIASFIIIVKWKYCIKVIIIITSLSSPFIMIIIITI